MASVNLYYFFCRFLVSIFNFRYNFLINCEEMEQVKECDPKGTSLCEQLILSIRFGNILQDIVVQLTDLLPRCYCTNILLAEMHSRINNLLAQSEMARQELISSEKESHNEKTTHALLEGRFSRSQRYNLLLHQLIELNTTWLRNCKCDSLTVDAFNRLKCCVLQYRDLGSLRSMDNGKSYKKALFLGRKF